MEGLWGLAGRMGRRPNRPEGRFRGRSPQRQRNAAGPAVGRDWRRGRPAGPYFAVGRGWKRSGMRAGETSLLAVGQGVWYH